MDTTRLTRSLVAVVAIFFAVLGLSFWVAPESAAHRFDLAPLGTAGVSALRADLGGLFVAIALLCAAGAWSKQRSWLLAAALVLASVVLGRMIGAVASGRVSGLSELYIELAALAAIVGCAHALRSGAPAARPRRARAAWVAGVSFVVMGGGLATVLSNARVEQWIFDHAAQDLAARVVTEPLVDDALRIAVCGSSAPLPSPTRAKACVAVFAGGKFWVVDAGPESVENLVRWGIPLSEIGGVLLTHFHSDHIGDLGELQLQTWAGGRPSRLAVYGGPGVERVIAGFDEAYRLDQGYRTAHHGEDVMPSATWGMTAHVVELDGAATAAKDRTGLVLDDGELRITAIEVDHAPIAPAYAYRFDYRGRSVVITGDLKYHPPLAVHAAGADVMVSEAIATNMTRSLGTAAHAAGREGTAAIMHDIEDYHVTPELAAELANAAGVKLLVYYHLLPAPDGWLPRRLFAHGVDAVRVGEWTIADDGSLYTLPLGSGDVQIGRMEAAQ
jgi:ribonuclease Z